MAKRESHIYHRKDGRWEGRFRIQTTGKYHSVYGKTYAEVREKLHRIRSEQDIAQNITQITFGEITKRWLTYITPQIKQSTLGCYQSKLRGRILPVFERHSDSISHLYRW